MSTQDPQGTGCHCSTQRDRTCQIHGDHAGGVIQKPGARVPVGEILGAVWSVTHTGGNCTGLQRAARTGAAWGYWLITDGDGRAPQSFNDPAVLCRCDADGITVGGIEFPTLRAALIAVAAAEGRAEDILTRLLSCLETSDDPAWSDLDGHAPLVREFRALLGEGI